MNISRLVWNFSRKYLALRVKCAQDMANIVNSAAIIQVWQSVVFIIKRLYDTTVRVYFLIHMNLNGGM